MNCKAIILVGGEGSRLRPISTTCPKPIVQFANKPGIVHQIEALKKAGINEIILAICHSLELFQEILRPWIEKVRIKQMH